MRVLSEGVVVSFICQDCGCGFVVGIKACDVEENDGNYYCKCPACMTRCHADVNCVIKVGNKDLDK